MTTQTDVNLYQEVKKHYIAYRTGSPLISDAAYDKLEKQLLDQDPDAIAKIEQEWEQELYNRDWKLPFPMPGIVECKTNDDVVSWSRRLKELAILITDKLDGMSVLLVYKHGKLSQAFSKHTGRLGKDITRYIKHVAAVPKQVDDFKEDTWYLRGELIIPKEVFDKKYSDTYKNARNMIAGQCRRRKPNQQILRDLHLVVYYATYAGEEDDGVMGLLSERLHYLRQQGFLIPSFTDVVDPSLFEKEDDFLETLTYSRIEESPYELDGVVLCVDDMADALRLGTEGSTDNKVAYRKFKIRQEGNLATTTVKHVEWNVAKDGSMRPVIVIEPVELMGATVSRLTGFNGFFICNGYLKNDGGTKMPIGKGAVINVTRSGDVIPYIDEVIEPAEKPDLPDAHEVGDYSWDTQGVHLVLDSPQEAMQVKKLIHFFRVLDIRNLAEKTVEKIFKAGYTTAAEAVAVILAGRGHEAGVPKAYSKQIEKDLKAALTDIYPPTLMYASDCFGLTVGKRRLIDVYEAFSGDILNWQDLSYREIQKRLESLDGWADTSAKQIVHYIDDWLDFYDDLEPYVTLKPFESSECSKEHVAFTGFRDKALEAFLTEKGFSVGNLTKKTTILVCSDMSSNSSKMQKARKQQEAGTLVIMSRDNFEKRLESSYEDFRSWNGS